MHWIWTAASLATAGLLFTRSRAKGGSSARQEVFLTFDDGPHPVHTPRLLELLARHQVPATFFLQGAKIEAHGEIVRRIVSSGHVIGNHSYSHASFDVSSLRKQVEEIDRTDELLTRYDGQQRHLLRPPHGKMSLSTILLCVLRQQRIALWSHDSYDYRMTSGEVIEHLSAQQVRAGDVVLFHDDGGTSLDALETLIPRWQASGFRFGTL